MSERSEADGWTELEEGFFAAAPPEVATAPAPAARFDDLEAPVPARLARKRGPERRARARRAPTERRAGRLAVGSRFLMRIARRAWEGARPAAARAWAWAAARAGLEAQRIGPALRAARARLGGGLSTRLARLVADLPEPPDGKTVVAAMAALVVVLGLSASVLGSRGALLTPAPAPEITLVPPVGLPAAPAVEPVAPAPAVEPAQVVAPRFEPVAKRHHAKRAALAPARKPVANKPARVR